MTVEDIIHIKYSDNGFLDAFIEMRYENLDLARTFIDFVEIRMQKKILDDLPKGVPND